MHNNKAQAAMEFLMTYGWAILIVLIVLAALFFLGVFSPQLGSSCVAVAPFTTCELKLVTGTTANANTIVLLYPAGSATGVKLNANSLGGGISCTTVSGNALTSVLSGAATTFGCSVSPGATGVKYGGTVEVAYASPAGVTHTIKLTVSGVVE